MREILFRGKRFANGEWVEGSLVQMLVDGRTAYCIAPINEVGRANKDVPPMGILYTLNEDIFIVHQGTIGQYTGLTDKNGKRIFEGDILCTNSTVLSKLIVHWFDRCGGFFLSDNKDIDASSLTPIYSANLYKYMVIGSIHDNPELLKGGNK